MDKLPTNTSPKEEIAILKAKLNQYDNLFKNAIDACGFIEESQSTDGNPHFKITEANSAFFKITDLKDHELPIDVETAFKSFENFSPNVFNLARNYKKSDTLDLILSTKSNQFKLRLKDNGLNSFSFSISDITDLQNQRNELIEKKKQLNESQQLAKIANWIEDHKSGKHKWSEEFYHILNTNPTETEASFNNFLHFVHPDDREKVEQGFKYAIKSKSGYELAHRLILKDGTIKHVNQKGYTLFNSTGNPLKSIGIIHDITNIVLIREELNKSEEIFRTVFHYAPIAVVIVNPKQQPVLLNKQFIDIVGYSEADLLKMNLQSITVSGSDNNQLLFDRLFKGNIRSFTTTKQYQCLGGRLVWVKETVSAIINQLGATEMAIAMVQNITAEKQAHDELINSEYKYRTLIENANDGIGLFDYHMKPIIYNTSLYEMLGYTRSEYMQFDHSNYELFHPDDKKDVRQAIEQVQKRQKVKIEKRLINKDGNYKHYSVSYIPVMHEEKPAILIFRRDISKRKAAEQQNEEYRLFLETIMENLPVGLFAKTTPDFRYLYWNKAMELLTGIEAEDAIGMCDNDLFQSKSFADDLSKEDHKILKSKSKIEKEHQMPSIIGQNKEVRTIKTIYNSPTGNPIILGISMDITELKNIEKQIEQSDQLLKEAQKITKLGYWEYDPKKDLIFDNLENRQIYGTDKLNYFLNSSQVLDLVLPHDKTVLESALKHCTEKKTPGEGIIRVPINDKIKHIIINYKPVLNDEGEVLKIRGTSLDISRIRESEIALRESEKKLKQAEFIAKVGYWNYDYMTKETEFSDEVLNILEVDTSHPKIQFSHLFESVHPDDKVATAAIFHRSRSHGDPFDFDFRIFTPSKKIKYIKAKGTFVKNSKNELVKSIGTFQDITQLKQKQIELERFSNHLKNIQQITQTGYIESEINNQSTEFSETMFSILETEGPLSTIEDYNTYIHPDDLSKVQFAIQDALKNNKTNKIEYRITTATKKIKTVIEICKLVRQKNPYRTHFNRIIQDITSLKEKEFALIKSEDQLNQAIKTHLIGTWEYIHSQKNYIFSEEAKRILNITPTTQPITTKDILNQIHPDDRYSVKKIFSKSFLQRQDYTLTYRLYPFNSNQVSFVKDSGKVAMNEKGEWVIYGTISDNSELKEVKQELNEQIDLMNQLWENSPLALSIVIEGQIEYANPLWKKYFSIKNTTKEKYVKESIEEDLIKFIHSIEFSFTTIIKEKPIELENGEKIKADLFLTKTKVKNKPALIIQLCIK